MTLEDEWASLEIMKVFPNTEIAYLPDTLTDSTKKKTREYRPR